MTAVRAVWPASGTTIGGCRQRFSRPRAPEPIYLPATFPRPHEPSSVRSLSAMSRAGDSPCCSSHRLSSNAGEIASPWNRSAPWIDPTVGRVAVTPRDCRAGEKIGCLGSRPKHAARDRGTGTCRLDSYTRQHRAMSRGSRSRVAEPHVSRARARSSRALTLKGDHQARYPPRWTLETSQSLTLQNRPPLDDRDW